MKKFTAVVLAAGMGKRLGELTTNTPKALMKVGDKTLVEHTIDFVKGVGVTDIVVVGGFHFDDVKQVVNNYDSNVTVVENKEYHLQNLLSVRKGLDQINEGSIFICNIDYIKSQKTIDVMKNNTKDIAVFASFDIEAVDDEMKVKVDDNRNLVGISKKLTDFEAVYTGDFYCNAKYLSNLKQAVQNALDNNDHQIAVTEHSFLELKEMGLDLSIVDVGKADWFEIDTPEELEAARQGINK